MEYFIIGPAPDVTITVLLCRIVLVPDLVYPIAKCIDAWGNIFPWAFFMGMKICATRTRFLKWGKPRWAFFFLCKHISTIFLWQVLSFAEKSTLGN